MELAGDSKWSGNIVCTGHSQGGAVATLAAFWLQRMNRDARVRCVTFGSPRVGNEGFVKEYNEVVKHHFRVETGNDPVPKVPSIRETWAHVGSKVFVVDDVHGVKVWIQVQKCCVGRSNCKSSRH